jgi:hypothetical protein
LQQLDGNNISKPLTDFAFSILDKVAQGSYTKWSIVYDISHKEIHFKTASNTDIKTIRFNTLDFACTGVPKMFDMNQQGNGDITGKFIGLDKELQQKTLIRAIEESSSQITIGNKERDAILSYSAGIKCK